MDLDRISVEARERSPWEALDLGCVMARAWWWPLFLSWMIPSAVVFVVISLLFVQENWLSYFVVWWLKPLWDRGALYIASRRLFGEPTGVRDVLRNLWRLYKTDLFLSLTLRRFSFTRSFDMPLTVLEHVKGKQRSSRQAILHRRHAGAASWLTVVGVFTESFLTLGLFVFLVMMVPEQVEIDYLGLFVEQEDVIVWLVNILYFCSMCLVGPFFAVSGFALYISRRIDLEAWDIEIRFRHLASAYAQKMDIRPGKLLSTLICTCVLSFAFIVAPVQSTFADELKSAAEMVAVVNEVDTTTGSEAEWAKEQIFNVLEDKDFHRIEQVSGWRVKDWQLSDPDEIPEWLIWLAEFMFDNADVFAGIGRFLKAPMAYIEYVLWGLAIFIVIYIMYRFRKNISDFVSTTDKKSLVQAPPEVMFGLDVTKESLPDDIPATVFTLWQSGDHRAAVSLLYRAMLTGLIHEYEFTFADSNTEGECVAIVKTRGNKLLSHYFTALTGCWQQLAYGHIVPESEQITKLCDNWREVFPHE
ncbi:hypothetical protein [Teredinibacter haidensis]|uniref:hypothetical protein n=1 Tax=Teredinibacter haidensis TaxID=2731755 RepID=UPI000948995F|nr:hypothetical protein [Teredinibacter haidensis]